MKYSSFDLPDGWSRKTIGEFARTYSGGTPSRERAEYFGGDIPWIRSGELNQQFVYETEGTLTKAGLDNSSAKMVFPGTLLLAIYGATAGISAITYIEAAINQAILAMVPNEEADAMFLFHWLTLNRQQIINEYQQGAQPNLSAEIVKSLLIALPPIDQQQRINEAVAVWDEAIALQTRQLQQLQRRKQVLNSELLTGDTRLPGFADEWKPGSLGDYFSERVERGDLELPLLAITANQGIIHRDTLVKRDTSNDDKSKYKRIRTGDIGYNTMRMWQGVSAVSAFDGIVSPAYTILKPLVNCDAGFMSHLFKWPPMIHTFKRNSQGLVDDTLLCKYDSFKRIAVKVPAVAEQRAIADVLNTADAEIRLHERKLEALRQQKRGLLQQLLTGEILLS
jgi:type I restriction enzyme S subunit